MGCLSSSQAGVYLAPKPTNSSFVRQMSNIREHYTVVRTLGTGNFGSIYLVKDKRCGIERVAKEIIKTLVKDNVMPALEKELSIVRDLEHPCILKLYEIIETNTRIYVITEYLSGGILFGRYSESPKINERLAARLISDIVLALNCIHKFKIIHCDVKPANLLFESDAPDSHVKLIDFGVEVLTKEQTFYSDSVHYMSPEYILGQPKTTKTDIWSTGVILYTMLTGILPFEAEDNEGTCQLIKRAQVDYSDPCWRILTPEVKALVQRMLSKNPKDRPSAEQILSDPWILSYNRNTLKDSPFDKSIQESLSKSVFSFISNQVLNSKDIKKLKEMFKGLDKDNSGTLTVAELTNGYDVIGVPPPSTIVDLMKKLDVDDSGSIDYFEFLKGSEEWSKFSMKKELDYAAKKYEKGSDAKLSLAELKSTIPDIQGTEWYNWLTSADKNGDGFITLDELRQYLSTKLGI